MVKLIALFIYFENKFIPIFIIFVYPFKIAALWHDYLAEYSIRHFAKDHLQRDMTS